jgi:hypothetical protein
LLERVIDTNTEIVLRLLWTASDPLVLTVCIA